MFDQIRSWLARRIAPQRPAGPPPQTRSKGLKPFPPPLPQPKKYVSKTAKPDAKDALRKALQGDMGFQWSSDHREESEQMKGWVAVAVSAMAREAAKSKVIVDRLIPPSGDDGGQEFDAKPVRWDHPLPTLFRRPNGVLVPDRADRADAINGAYGWRGLVKRIVIQRALTGSALVWAVPSVEGGRDGHPCELYVIPTALALPSPPAPDMPCGGYRVCASSLMSSFGGLYGGLPVAALSSTYTLDARHVIRLSNYHPLTESDGLSPLNANDHMIDVATETEELIWGVLQNGAFPAAIASMAPNAAAGSDMVRAVMDEMKDWIEQEYAGAQNAGKLLPVYGMTLQKLALSLTEAVTPELRTQNRDGVLAGFGAPAVAAGLQDGGSYSANHASRQQFIDGVIQPELDEIADLLTVRLAHRYDDDLVVRIEAAAVNDEELELRKTEQKTTSAVYTVDEIRALYGDGPHPDKKIGQMAPGAVVAYQQSKFAPQQPPAGDPTGQSAPAGDADDNRAGTVLPSDQSPAADDTRGGVLPSSPNQADPMRRDNPAALQELASYSRAKGMKAEDVMPTPAMPPFSKNGHSKNGKH